MLSKARRSGWWIVVPVLVVLTACGPEGAGDDDDDVVQSPEPSSTQTPQPVSFTNDIIPIFEQTCGASVAGCHDAAPYNASEQNECRGWLSLANEPLGSVVNSGPNQGNPTGCPDFTLYERLLDVNSWTCGNYDFIVPGDPTASYLIQRITLDPNGPCALPDDPQAMPPVGSISSEDLATLMEWISDGALNN